MSGKRRRYSAYGLTIDSNLPLPGVPLSGEAEPDVTIDFRADREPLVEPAARHSSDRYGWQSVTPLAGGGRLFRCAANGGERAWSMEVSADGAHVEVRWTSTMDLADLLVIVVTRGLAISLGCRRTPLLHACAITVATEAIAIVGRSGAGKSTIAAAAVARGSALLADDMAALTLHAGRVSVEPGIHRMRLDEQTAEALGWDPAGLPHVFADPMLAHKRYVELSSTHGSFCSEPRPLRGILVLGSRTTGEPEITRLPPATALPHILTNTFADDLLDHKTRAIQLPFWARVATAVPVGQLRPSDDLAALPALLPMIEEWAIQDSNLGPLPYQRSAGVGGCGSDVGICG